MPVGGFRGAAATVNWLVSAFKKERPAAAQILVNLAIPDTFLADYLQPFVNDATNYARSPLFDELAGILQTRLTQSSFKPEYSVDGIEVQITEEQALFPRGLEVKVPQAGRCEVGTHWMSVKAKVAVRGMASTVRRWEVGFIQTITRLERQIVWNNKNGKVATMRSVIPMRCKDGPNNYQGVWFDDGCKKALAEETFQVMEVEMRDRPSFGWDAHANYALDRVRGGEAFQTWLALRRSDGSKTKFLRMWEWHTDYCISEQNIPRFGICFDGYQKYSDGTGAVLTGMTGKDLMKTTFEER